MKSTLVHRKWTVGKDEKSYSAEDVMKQLTEIVYVEEETQRKMISAIESRTPGYLEAKDSDGTPVYKVSIEVIEAEDSIWGYEPEHVLVTYKNLMA